MLPLLLFHPFRYDLPTGFHQAQIAWIPARVRELHGGDPERIKKHLDQYPALQESSPQVEQPGNRISWSEQGPGLTLTVKWWGSAMRPVAKTTGDLGVISYRSADDFIITPAIGPMSTGLHPLLALWAIFLGLSSLARYEPAAWSKVIDIDRSAEANAIVHLLDEGVRNIPVVAFHLLTSM